MATQFATPLTTQSQIQTWLNAGDDVVLSAGSVYPIIVDQLATNGFGINVPAGRFVDLNGATLLLTGILNQTVDGSGTAVIGSMNVAGANIRNGTIRGPANRAPAGGRANTSNRLVYLDANGITMNAVLDNLTLIDGPNQALQLNNVNTATIRNLVTPRPSVATPASGVFLGHYVDMDSTANNRLTQNITFENCDLDAFGQECIKLENASTIRFRGTKFRTYVTLAQDEVGPHSQMSDVEFDDACEFYSYIGLQNLRRRYNGSAVDNLGNGTVVIRGRFIGDDALILGGLSSPDIVAGFADQNAADAAMFANLTADLCRFEGKNSHMVPVSGSAWITRSVGVKDRVTMYARQSRSSHYPFGISPPVVKGDVTPTVVNNLTTTVSTGINAATVGNYYLATRGVTLELESTAPWTGANNTGGWPLLNVNVPVDFVGEGGASNPAIIDSQGGTAAGFSISGTNTAKVRFIDIECRNSQGGSSSRAWTINNAAADVELYNVKGRNCTTTNGGAGGRFQAYAAGYIGPGCESINCVATGGNGGGPLIDSSGTSVVTVEGHRSIGCSATSGSGAGMRINSGYAVVRSLEMVNCSAPAGTGGLSISWSIADSITQNIRNVSGRGNTSVAGTGTDISVYVGTAGSTVDVRSSVLASGGLVMNKTGSGTLAYGQINSGISGTLSIGAPLSDLGGNQTSDPLLVTDTTSVALQATSPCKNAATPFWTVNVQRPTLAHDGSYFLTNLAGNTSMGARF